MAKHTTTQKVAAQKVAAPAAQKEEKKAKKSRFVVHPLVADKDAPKLTEIPADYDYSTHKPLRKNQFEDDALFFEFLAGKKEHEATQLRAKAAEIRTLGSKSDRAAARQLAKLRTKYESLAAKLTAQGLDPEALMEVAMQAMKAKETAKTA